VPDSQKQFVPLPTIDESSMDSKIRKSDIANPEARQTIRYALVAHDDSKTGPNDVQPLAIRMIDDSDSVMGRLRAASNHSRRGKYHERDDCVLWSCLHKYL
jgi:hypothetical protein